MSEGVGINSPQKLKMHGHIGLEVVQPKIKLTSPNFQHINKPYWIDPYKALQPRLIKINSVCNLRIGERGVGFLPLQMGRGLGLLEKQGFIEKLQYALGLRGYTSCL